MTDCDYSSSVLERSLGILDQARALEIEAHVASCPACRRVASAAGELEPALALPDEKPAADGWERLAERIDLDRRRANVRVSVGCSYCHGALVREEAVYCASCLAPHHGDCFSEHGKCSAAGCGETRFVESRVAAPSRAGEPRAGRGRGILLLSLGLVLGVGAAAALLPSPGPASTVYDPTQPGSRKGQRSIDTGQDETFTPVRLPSIKVNAHETLLIWDGTNYAAIVFDETLVDKVGEGETRYRAFFFGRSAGASPRQGVLRRLDHVDVGPFELRLQALDGSGLAFEVSGRGCRFSVSGLAAESVDFASLDPASLELVYTDGLGTSYVPPARQTRPRGR